ncbi:hypothetical protein SVAN01_05918 [Stagonosporopsis vannaccii]|nr:hypothetical protein SVAN01_05918 [Stagonosporopsis vannaccii]
MLRMEEHLRSTPGGDHDRKKTGKSWTRTCGVQRCSVCTCCRLPWPVCGYSGVRCLGLSLRACSTSRLLNSAPCWCAVLLPRLLRPSRWKTSFYSWTSRHATAFRRVQGDIEDVPLATRALRDWTPRMDVEAPGAPSPRMCEGDRQLGGQDPEPGQNDNSGIMASMDGGEESAAHRPTAAVAAVAESPTTSPPPTITSDITTKPFSCDTPLALTTTHPNPFTAIPSWRALGFSDPKAAAPLRDIARMASTHVPAEVTTGTTTDGADTPRPRRAHPSGAKSGEKHSCMRGLSEPWTGSSPSIASHTGVSRPFPLPQAVEPEQREKRDADEDVEGVGEVERECGGADADVDRGEVSEGRKVVVGMN